VGSLLERARRGGSALSPNLSASPSIEEPVSEAIPTIRKNRMLERTKGLVETEGAERSVANMNKNSAIREAASRFARDRFGMTNIDEDQAMEEFIEHFREFSVNEITAAGDYNYVSAAAADATGKTGLNINGKERAAQRLSDYRLLYQTFNEMPAFSDGFWTATGDYAEGIFKAPSTYVGLLLPGVGKGSGVAATQMSKHLVNKTLAQALRSPVTTLANKAASNPIKTTMAVEGVAGTLQNIAEQKTEMEIDLRDDFDLSQTALVGGVSAVAPVALAPSAIKGLLKGKIEAETGEITEAALRQLEEANEAANEAAEKTLKSKSSVAQKASSVLPPLDPARVAAGREQFAETAEDLGVPQVGDKEGVARTIGADPDQLAITSDFVLSLDPNRTKRIWAAATEILAKSPTIKDDLGKLRITELVADVIRDMNKKKAGRGDKFYLATLKRYNITQDDFANMFMADVSDSARKLRMAAQAKQDLTGVGTIFRDLNSVTADTIFALDDVAKKTVEKLNKATLDQDVRKILQSDKEVRQVAEQTWLKSLDALRLSAMTSQTATTFRNMVSGYSRVGFDIATRVFDRAIDAGISKVSGRQVRQTPNEDIIAIAYGLVNGRESKAIEQIFRMGFHNKASQLFRELQDIPADNVGGKTMRMRGLARELNALNTLSDNMFKRAAFVGGLKRSLNELYTIRSRKAAKAGKEAPDINDYNLVNIIKENKFNDTFTTKEGKALLDKAVSDALYFTYQRSPDNPIFKALIQGVHKYPFLTSSVVPFPRFIANAMRFTYEYSPLYIVEGAKRNLFRESANYDEIGKALVGTSFLIGSMAFRQSEFAGENWWEAKTSTGQTFDLRPFFPAAPYLFVADLLNRYMSDNDDPVLGDRNFITDAVQALSGTQFRAGFGIYALDSALKDLFRDDIDASKKIETLGVNFAANILNTYTIPITAGQDLYNTFLAPDDERIVRQTNSSNILELTINKTLARLPGNYAIEKMLAEQLGINAPDIYESPTRDDPLRRVTPITRQTYGILLNDRKNFLEKELARLKISNRILSQKTGVPEADTMINALIGEYATDYIVPIMRNSDRYKDMKPDEQKEYIRQVIQNYKSEVMAFVKYRARRGGRERYGFDPMERVEFNRLRPMAQRRALEKYHRVYGKPEEGQKYDYEILTIYGKDFQKAGP